VIGRDDPKEPAEEPEPWSRAETDEEPEPDWAEQIRAARRSRGERLKDVFATFSDEDQPKDPPV
jgi:hypothetical protein